MNGMEKMLKTVGDRLGMSPAQLLGALEKKDMNSILGNMNPADKQKIKSVLDSGSAVEMLMRNPKAAEFMKSMGKK
jgi:hypothetical protein